MERYEPFASVGFYLSEPGARLSPAAAGANAIERYEPFASVGFQFGSAAAETTALPPYSYKSHPAKVGQKNSGVPRRLPTGSVQFQIALKEVAEISQTFYNFLTNGTRGCVKSRL